MLKLLTLIMGYLHVVYCIYRKIFPVISTAAGRCPWRVLYLISSPQMALGDVFHFIGTNMWIPSTKRFRCFSKKGLVTGSCLVFFQSFKRKRKQTNISRLCYFCEVFFWKESFLGARKSRLTQVGTSPWAGRKGEKKLDFCWRDLKVRHCIWWDFFGRMIQRLQ